jgi:phytol kinase
LLCGGDALADIVGTRFSSLSLPWSKRKSLAGSIAMFVGGWVFAMVILAIYVSLGKFTGPFSNYVLAITLISLIGAVVESLPFKDIDNITVPAIAVILGYFWLP